MLGHKQPAAMQGPAAPPGVLHTLAGQVHVLQATKVVPSPARASLIYAAVAKIRALSERHTTDAKRNIPVIINPPVKRVKKRKISKLVSTFLHTQVAFTDN
jgi:hypothetical protein